MIKKNLDKILIGVSLLLAAVAIVLLVAPGIALKSQYKDIESTLSAALGFSVSVPKSYSMADITFGHSQVFKFSFPNLLTYILIAGGIVCAVLSLLGKGGKIVSYVAACLFLVGGVLYFCAGKLLVLVGKDTGYYTIGFGSILGGIFSILAAIAALVPVFIKK